MVNIDSTDGGQKMNYEQYKDKIKNALKCGCERIGNTDIPEEVINEYTNKLIKYLNERKDARSIKCEDELYKAFFYDDRPLNSFYKFVLEKQGEENLSKRLVIGFRGNRIVIYYYNHVLWELSKSRGKNLMFNLITIMPGITTIGKKSIKN